MWKVTYLNCRSCWKALQGFKPVALSCGLADECYLLQVGITHWFSILKARRELGYVPFVEPKEGLRRTLEFWKEEQSKAMLWVPLSIWLLIIIGMVLTYCCGFLPPNSMGIFEVFRQVLIKLYRSHRILQAIFVLACIVHIGEGAYAWFLARRVDPENAVAWCWQTTMLGFPSLMLLRGRARERCGVWSSTHKWVLACFMFVWVKCHN